MRTLTIPAALAQLLRTDPARPLVTFYDDATGERVELSTTTYANWVSKTANLVQDELDVEYGGTVLVDLPTHWLGVVWLGAAWSLGLGVCTDPDRADEADLVVCGPDGVDRYAATAAGRPVVALSLRPLGARFADPLPAGVVDYGAVVLGQPDVLVAHQEPVGTEVAWSSTDGDLTQTALLEQAAGNPVVESGGRLLTDVNPCSRLGAEVLAAALAHGAGVVWVARPDQDAWESRAQQERATAQLRETRS